ncbi:MAG: hydrogenase maturation nickel metallochaperone HypA [bacterium]|nr:hydrogenase maturation nickel metallochaperone HypA [bacterium]
MHELSIITAIFNIIEKVSLDNNLKTVHKVHLKIGKMRQVIPDMLKFAFDAVSKDTIAENAELLITYIPIIMKCKSCLCKFEVNENIYICPSCDQTDLEALSGQEVLVDSLEGDK